MIMKVDLHITNRSVEGEIREVFLAHKREGAENERLGALIGVFSTKELARDVAKGQGSLGKQTNGEVIHRHAVVSPPTTEGGVQDVYVLDPAYESVMEGVVESFRLVLDDDAGLRVVRDRALTKLEPEERAALGFPDKERQT